MKNLKYIVAFAIFGFFLSIVFALTAHVSFGWMLFRAFCFGVGFGVLGFGASYLLDNILGIGEQVVMTSTESAAQKAPTSSHAVDLYIENEELPSQTDEARFVVGMKPQMLTPSDVGKNNPYAQTQVVKPSKSKFKTVESAEQLKKVTTGGNQTSSTGGGNQTSSTEATNEGGGAPKKPLMSDAPKEAFKPIELGKGKVKSGSDVLDTLPDLESLVGSKNEGEAHSPSGEKTEKKSEAAIDSSDDAMSELNDVFGKDDATKSTATKETPSAVKTKPSSSTASESGSLGAGQSAQQDDDDDLAALSASEALDTDGEEDEDEDDGGYEEDEGYSSVSSDVAKMKIPTTVEGKDSELMAKAISTILAEDKS